MKTRFFRALCVLTAASACLLCACDKNSASDAESSITAPIAQGIKLSCPETDFDARYAACIKAYFESLEARDFEAYKKTVYPPYLESYGSFLTEQESSLEKAFDSMCSSFDEDGYDSWRFTQLDMKYSEKEDIDDFFESYEQVGIFDSDFSEKTRADAEEIRDVEFTLYALYDGDLDATPVVQSQEIIVIHSKDGGYYLFG